MNDTASRHWTTVLPKFLPAGWSPVEERMDGYCYDRPGIGGNLRVIASVNKQLDNKDWLHVSFSRPDRLPSWDDLKEVKELFIGKDKTALQVLPPEANFVNIHPYCLHLWHCLDGDVTPDFTQGTGQI